MLAAARHRFPLSFQEITHEERVSLDGTAPDTENWNQQFTANMRHLAPFRSDQASTELRSILGMFRASLDGAPETIGLLAHSPAALKAYLGADYELSHGYLPIRTRELIALAVAEINGSQACLKRHRAIARTIGLTSDDIHEAAQATAADPKANSMLRFVQAVVLQRGDVNDDDILALYHAGFSDAEIIEIVSLIGLNIFTNYLSLLFFEGASGARFSSAPELKAIER